MKEQNDGPPCRGPRDEPWQPALRQHYFVILGNGSIKVFQWSGTPLDYEAWQFGNCFRTRREADRAREVVRQVLWTLHTEYRR